MLFHEAHQLLTLNHQQQERLTPVLLESGHQQIRTELMSCLLLKPGSSATVCCNFCSCGTLNIGGATPRRFKCDKTHSYIAKNKSITVQEMSGIAFDYTALLHFMYLLKYSLIFILQVYNYFQLCVPPPSPTPCKYHGMLQACWLYVLFLFLLCFAFLTGRFLQFPKKSILVLYEKKDLMSKKGS